MSADVIPDCFRPGGARLALFALLGISLFSLVSFVVGGRLLWVAHRTGLLPEKRIGGSLFLAGGIGTALLFLSFASDWVSGHYLGVRRSGFSMTADYIGRFAMYGWASLETLRQSLLARRRVRIGLTEPLVANRFLLWGISTLAANGIWAYSLWSELVENSDMTEFYLVASVLGSTCALAIWLAFFPPQLYRRRFATSPASA